MEFKEKLRKLRTEAGLSQEALADIIHISRSAIAKYENGNGNPSEETLKALAFYFGVDINDLKSDEVIKKENKKNILKLTGIVGLIMLIVGIITTSTIGIINFINNNHSGDNPSTSELVGGTPTKLIGIYESIGLQNMDDTIPYEEHPTESNSYIYTVNTYMSFTIDVFPNFSFGSQAMLLCGDIAEFEKDYFGFARISYDYSQDTTRYIINFKKEGYFEIKYTVYEYTRVVKFKCDNSSSEWTKYQKDIAYFYPWIKNISFEDITSIRYEINNRSLGPEYFRNIYYSISNNDLIDAYNFLLGKLWYSNSYVTGDNLLTNIITYYFQDGTSQSISLANNSIPTNDVNYYVVEKTFSKPAEYYEKRLGFNEYGKDIKAIVKENSNSEYKITNFYDIEFIEWPLEEGYENVEVVFTISGYPAEILVYSYNRFSYNGKLYKVISNDNFSEIFNWYNLFNK